MNRYDSRPDPVKLTTRLKHRERIREFTLHDFVITNTGIYTDTTHELVVTGIVVPGRIETRRHENVPSATRDVLITPSGREFSHFSVVPGEKDRYLVFKVRTNSKGHMVFSDCGLHSCVLTER